jgi:RHS repeat-associated protein
LVRAPNGLRTEFNSWQVLRYDISNGTPSIKWQSVAFPDVGSSLYGAGLSLGDFNGDGLPDVWTASGDQATIWLNSGDGRFWDKSLVRPALTRQGQTFQNTRTAVLDFDADGRVDLFEQWEADGFFPAHQARMPNRAITAIASQDVELRSPGGSQFGANFNIAGDVDGDGNIDVFGHGAGVVYGSGAKNLLLNRVVDGLGNLTTVHYSSDAYETDETCLGTGPLRQGRKTWPETCLTHINGLVSSHDEGVVDANGQESLERNFKYKYFNARMNVTGQGWLGFDRRTVTRKSGGLSQIVTTEYESVARYTLQGQPTPSTAPPYIYPLAGLPKAITIDDGSDTEATIPEPVPPLESGYFMRRTRIENHWTVQMSAAGRTFPFVGSRTTSTFDRDDPRFPASDPPFEQNGTLLMACTESFTPDNYGNVVSYEEKCQEASQTQVERTATTTTIVPKPLSWRISEPDHITRSHNRSFALGIEKLDMTYTASGLLETVTRGQGETDKQRKTTFVRGDAFNNVTQVIEEVASGEPSRTTTTTYDADGIFPLTITNAKGQTTKVLFDKRFGTPKTTADPNGIAVVQVYDAFGRLVETDTPQGTTVATFSAVPEQSRQTLLGTVHPRIEISIESQGTLGTRTGAAAKEYDNYGRLVHTRAEGFGGAFVVEDQAYDSRGHLRGRTIPHAANAGVVPTVKLSYDYLDRVTKVEESTGTPTPAIKQYQYATRNTLRSEHQNWLDGVLCGGVSPSNCTIGITASIDEAGKQNVAITDHRGLVVRSLDGDNVVSAAHTSNYVYGGFNRLIELRDNLGHLTKLVNDDLGRVRQQFDPDVGRTDSTYNGYDELVTRTDPKTQLLTFHYDQLGRLTSIIDPAGTTQWIYDQGVNAIGRLAHTISPATPENPNGQQVQYTYEPPTDTQNRGALKRVESVFDGTSYPLTFDYDDLGRNEFTHYPVVGGGTPVVAKYHYEPSGILTTVEETGGAVSRPLWSLDEADDAQLIKRETFGNGASTVYGYHPHRRWLTNIQTTTDEVIQQLEYTHYDNGSVHFKRDETVQREHFYDPLNRLSSTLDTVSGGTQSTSYGYDDAGNITTRGSTTLTYLPSKPHLLDTVGANTYQYDLNGNVSQRSGPDVPRGFQSFEYTPFNLPTVIHTGTGASEKITKFDYTADEARAVRRDADTTRYFVRGMYERAVATTGGSTVEERFCIYAGGRKLGEIVRKDGSDQTLFFHADNLSSVDAISRGTDSFRQQFDPYGMPIDPPSPALTRVGFTGHHHDDDLGLIDMKGRIYDPLAARFTSADPIAQIPVWSQGLNRYSYAFNDPINHTDPSGFAVDFGDERTQATAGFSAYAAIMTAASGGGLGFAFSGFNLGLSGLAGLPGSGKAGGTINVTAMAAPTSAGASPGAPNPASWNRGSVGPDLRVAGPGGGQAPELPEGPPSWGRSGVQSKNVTLEFDGMALKVIDRASGFVVAQFGAITGDPELGWNWKDEGPTPPGGYTVNRNTLESLPGLRARGLYRPSVSWGDQYRIILKPDKGTDVFGREGMFLHGGSLYKDVPTGGNIMEGTESFYTHGCIKINDASWAQLKQYLESNVSSTIPFKVDYSWSKGVLNYSARIHP